MAMQHPWFLKFLQSATRQKYIMVFPNTKCCENHQNKNKELLLQCSSWAGWLKDATKAFKPHSRCCQVWDTLCGPAKTRSQKPKIQISSFLPGPQQFSKNFPNQGFPRRFKQKQWVQLHGTPTPQPMVTMSHLWSWTVTHCHPSDERDLCGYNFSWQAAESKAVPCLFLPQGYSQQYTQALSIKDRTSILQTTQIQVARSILILPFSNCWFSICNIHIL